MKTNKKLTKSGINRLIVIHLILLIQCVIFFSAAGHFNIKRAWIFFGLSFLFLIINTLIAIFFSPEIANVRGEMQKGTKTWDKVFIAVYTPMTLALPLIAGLDVGRFGWSYLGTGSLYAGIIIFLIGGIFTDWALFSNIHFETTVRIQTEKDHKVITDGPYKIIRHPGYVGILLNTYSTSLILGSLYSLIPVFIMTVLFIIRTHLEDKTLRDELDGYSDYAKKVRFRLIPGIW